MEPREFYEKVKSRFSVLVNKYGFEPVFELEPAGSFGFSQIIFRSEQGLIQFNVDYRDLDVSILLSFDIPSRDVQASIYGEKLGGNFNWHNIVIVLNAMDVQVNYDHLYSEMAGEKEWGVIINSLLDNWAAELSPHWDRIITGMGNSEFQQKVKSMDGKGKHQRILRFDQYGMGKSLAKDAAGGLLKFIPAAIGYIASLAFGLYLLRFLPNSIPGSIGLLIVLVPPYIFYLLLKYLEKRKQQSS